MTGLRALGLKGDWVLSTLEGTVSDDGGEVELPPRQEDAPPVVAEIVTLENGRALRLRGSVFGPDGRLVRMADEAAVDHHPPLGLFLDALTSHARRVSSPRWWGGWTAMAIRALP